MGESITLNKSCNQSLKSYFHDDDIPELGLDEVGRGCLFGRVYVAGVILPKNDPQFQYHLLKDSKKFSSVKKINKVAEYIKEHAIAWHVSFMDENVIDSKNILHASQLAFHDAVKNILSSANIPKTPLLLVDGNYFTSYINFDVAKKTFVEIPHVCITNGDNTYCSIAAASILAKVARDNYIIDLCDLHVDLDEKYKLKSNKGYGTADHLHGIHEHGITDWHRKSFGICKQYANK